MAPKKRSRLLCCLFGLLVASALACRASPPGVRIVFITLDTLRLDSFMGSDGVPSQMPQLAQRARDGLVFERYYATASTTKPTHATLFTGLQPWQHGVTRNHKVLSPELVTLAERLREAGFATGAVVASFALARRFGFDQGFDRYDDDLAIGYAGKPAWSPAEHVTDAALALLDEVDAPRQFFWIHYFDPHNPYGASTGEPLKLADLLEAIEQHRGDSERLVAAAREHYDRDVRYLDAQLERLFARLERDSRAYATHVVVSADHGESFGENGSLSHDKRLTDVMIHVPLLVLSPGVAPGRRREAVGSVDVMATVLALAGQGDPPAGTRDLLDPEADRGRIFGMRRTWSEPVEEVRLDGTRHPVPKYQFYAVDGDAVYRGDRTRVTRGDEETPAEGPEGEALRALFADFEQQYERLPENELVDSETSEALRQLGYVR